MSVRRAKAVSRELEYATHLAVATYLAVALWEKHWKTEAPDWKPLPDLLGVLTQIDNMTAGLVREPDRFYEIEAWGNHQAVEVERLRTALLEIAQGTNEKWTHDNAMRALEPKP